MSEDIQLAWITMIGASVTAALAALVSIVTSVMAYMKSRDAAQVSAGNRAAIELSRLAAQRGLEHQNALVDEAARAMQHRVNDVAGALATKVDATNKENKAAIEAVHEVVKVIKIEVNDRLSQLLAVTKAEAHARGVLDGASGTVKPPIPGAQPESDATHG